MQRIIVFLRTNLFKMVVLVSLCVIIYYATRAETVTNHCTKETEGKKYETSESSNNERTQVSSLTLETSEKQYLGSSKKTAACVNNVKLAEIIGDEQKVIVESNTWQFSPDVILVQKGMRANWIFRLINNEECNGKILIERFGLIVPFSGKEMSMIFTPWKDFTITCDQGKFNYYIKAVEKLGTTNIISENKNSQKTVLKNQSHKTGEETPKTVKPIPTVKPEENKNQNINKEADTTFHHHH